MKCPEEIPFRGTFHFQTPTPATCRLLHLQWQVQSGWICFRCGEHVNRFLSFQYILSGGALTAFPNWRHRQPTRVVDDMRNSSRWLITVWFSQETALAKIFPILNWNPPKPCCVCWWWCISLATCGAVLGRFVELWFGCVRHYNKNQQGWQNFSNRHYDSSWFSPNINSISVWLSSTSFDDVKAKELVNICAKNYGTQSTLALQNPNHLSFKFKFIHFTIVFITNPTRHSEMLTMIMRVLMLASVFPDCNNVWHI